MIEISDGLRPSTVHTAIGAPAQNGAITDAVGAADGGAPSLRGLDRRRHEIQVRGYFLVFVPTIREIRDFYREM